MKLGQRRPGRFPDWAMARNEAWPAALSCCCGAAGFALVSDSERARAAGPALRAQNSAAITAGSSTKRSFAIRGRFTGLPPASWELSTARCEREKCRQLTRLAETVPRTLSQVARVGAGRRMPLSPFAILRAR